jgi:ubiquinone/menaquinone biosynthesis C-methylase UbiE
MMKVEEASEPNSALARMRDLIVGFCISRSIATVAELGIADRLANGSRTAAELASDCGVQERPLFRVLRALAGEGVFGEGEDGRFGLTPTADLLRTDHPSSLRDWAIYVNDLTFRASFELLHTVRTGELAFPRVFGTGLFEYLGQHPEHSEKLLRAMSSISAARTAGLLEAYDFGPSRRLVDVGGAHGTMVAAIAERYPRLHCTTFDRPSAEPGALETFTERLIADRCDFVGGDFFHDDLPEGADTYLLSAILHDWDDERCQQILRNCRRAISETGRLLVVEIVLSDERNVPDTYRNCLDLAVMLQLGGMERSESEFRALLRLAGFNVRQVLPMNAPQSVLVAFPE